MNDPSRISVQVKKTFSVPPERVYDAWLDPGLIGKWMMGPELRDEETVHLRVDPQVGGEFSFLVRRGGIEIDHIGTYRELDRPRRLVFTWGIAGESVDESTVHIEITANSAGCELSLTHEMDVKWAEYADRTQAGWTTMLNALGRILT